MTKNAMNQRRWRIGELAALTGLTVRTLRHYEGIGLLASPSRTAGRQRLYNEHDVQRLYRIRALRALGLPLADIGRMLDSGAAALGDVMRAHHARVDAELKRLSRLSRLLKNACAQADRGTDPDVLATIEAMSLVAQVDRPPAPRAQRERMQSHWRELGRQLRLCMAAGDAPSAPRVMRLARAVRQRIDEFAQGDAAKLKALAHLRKFAPPRNLAGWDPALMRYLDQALAHLSHEGETC